MLFVFLVLLFSNTHALLFPSILCFHLPGPTMTTFLHFTYLKKKGEKQELWVMIISFILNLITRISVFLIFDDWEWRKLTRLFCCQSFSPPLFSPIRYVFSNEVKKGWMYFDRFDAIASASARKR